MSARRWVVPASWLTVALVASAALAAPAAPAGRAEAEALVQAVRQSMRLYETLQVRWVCETIGGPLAAPSSSPASAAALDLSPTMRLEWTATLDGIRNRLEQRQIITLPGVEGADEVSDTVAVFDGVRYRREETSITHPDRPRRGWEEDARDRNLSLIRSVLFQVPFHLESPRAIKDWTLSAEPAADGRCWVLTCTPPRENVSYRLTIDPARGNGLRKIESLSPDGRVKHYDVDVTLADDGDGRWYIAGALRRDYDPKDPSKGRPTLRVTVTDVTFDGDVDDSVFDLQFREGTQLWDAAHERWVPVRAAARPASQPAGDQAGKGGSGEDE